MIRYHFFTQKELDHIAKIKNDRKKAGLLELPLDQYAGDIETVKLLREIISQYDFILNNIQNNNVSINSSTNLKALNFIKSCKKRGLI